MKSRIAYRVLSLMATFVVFVASAKVVCAAEPVSGSWQALEEEAIRLLGHYIQIDTTNPPGNELKAAQFFKEIFEREGIEARIIESAPGRGNVIARLPGDGSKPALILMN